MKDHTTEKPWVDRDYLLEKSPEMGGWTYTIIPEIAPDPNSPSSTAPTSHSRKASRPAPVLAEILTEPDAGEPETTSTLCFSINASKTFLASSVRLCGGVG